MFVGILAVVLLREATFSTHQAVPRDSRIELVVAARSHRGERGQTLAEMVEAQVLTCRLEVKSDLVGEIEAAGDDRFRALLAPGMDQTDKRQFRGCLEDWKIDSFQLDVISLAEPT
jgi:hypothetical protein